MVIQVRLGPNLHVRALVIMSYKGSSFFRSKLYCYNSIGTRLNVLYDSSLRGISLLTCIFYYE